MASFHPSKKTASDFNNGVKYVDYDASTGENGDSVQADTVNNLIESALYTQQVTESAKEQARQSAEAAKKAQEAAERALIKFDIGDYFITANSTSPAARFGGSWEELPQGTFLEAAQSLISGGKAGESKEAGLPNIKGDFGTIYTFIDTHFTNGAIYEEEGYRSGNSPYSSGSSNGYGMYIGIDASKSNSIYKDGVTTVQPKSITAHIWRRVS